MSDHYRNYTLSSELRLHARTSLYTLLVWLLCFVCMSFWCDNISIAFFPFVHMKNMETVSQIIQNSVALNFLVIRKEGPIACY